MSKGIATLAALGMIGASALGLEALAVTRIAEGAGGWLAGAEALALGRAGRIVAATMARAAGDRAREAALTAALGAMRSAGLLFELTRAPDAPPAGTMWRSAPAPCPVQPAAAPLRARHLPTAL